MQRKSSINTSFRDGRKRKYHRPPNGTIFRNKENPQVHDPVQRTSNSNQMDPETIFLTSKETTKEFTWRMKRDIIETANTIDYFNGKKKTKKEQEAKQNKLVNDNEHWGNKISSKAIENIRISMENINSIGV